MDEERIKEELPFYHWLAGISGIGDETIKSILRVYPYPSEIYYGSDDITDALSDLGVITNKQRNALNQAKRVGDIFSPYTLIKKASIQLVPCVSKDFPERFQSIPDYPGVLYFKGTLPPAFSPLIAIVGTRDCTSYGARMAEYFGSKMAEAGVGVISGMARGIDGIAQRATLKAGGRSFGVLGCGVDICYPKQNMDLYADLIKGGCVMSSYVPGTKPMSCLFPARNRIISALSDGVLVIEARLKSGSRITVDMALEQGKDVFAVPGRIDDPLSIGCNDLIKEGAGVADSADTVLEALWGRRLGAMSPEILKKKKLEDTIKKVPSDEGTILRLLDDYPKPIEQLLIEANMDNLSFDPSTLRQLLIRLCIKGYAIEEGGGFIRRL